MTRKEREDIDRMCHPRGLAIFGSMGKPGAFAHSILTSHLLYGYTGKIYPISRQGEEVSGLKIYRSLAEVEGPVDLAVVSVPAPFVPKVLRECLAHGVAGATIQTSGFAETNAEGKALQDEIGGISQQGLRTIGPNCFGIHCPKGGLTFLPGFDYPKESGQVGMVFQSGGMANDLIHEAEATGVRFSKVFSFGNGCDLDAIRLMEYLAEDPETNCIAAYLEGIGDGRRLLDLLTSITPKKPVVIWKGGLTPFGARATMSHTGSLGGQAAIWNGALAQAGAIQVRGFDEMMDTLVALSFQKKRGTRVALMGGGGAIGVHSADLAFQLGLEIPTFSKETQARLKEILPTPGAGLSNPLDMATPALPLKQVIALTQEVMRQEPIDALITISLLHPIDVTPKAFFKALGLKTPDSSKYFDALLDVLVEIRKETGKDVIVVLENRAHRVIDLDTETLLRKTRKKFHQRGIPVFPSAERALIALHKISKSKQQSLF
ncbi:MAG: hypothetical protein GY860_14850 [Desulfobacteraceae bacterium]|nr:hypothetical protein [Desulfobacteraceae bacterium]